MMKKNILVVGAGSIGKRHLSHFKNYFKKIYVCDARKDRLDEVNKKFKISESFLNYKEALNSNLEFDAVCISTPPHIHYQIAKHSINKNKAIFIEKPLGMNSKGWMDLAKKCNKKNLINYVAYCHRHINYTKIFKRYISQGLIGKVINANVRWGSYFPDWHPWEDYRSYYMAKKEQGGGALMDESHGIDLVRYFFGEAKEIFAYVDKISSLEINADDNAFLTLKMKNKMVIHISFDLISRSTNCKIEVNGSKGTMIWDRVSHKLEIFNSNKKKWKILKFSKKDFLEMYSSQAKHFYNCLLKKEKPLIDIRDAVKTQTIIDKSFLLDQLIQNF